MMASVCTTVSVINCRETNHLTVQWLRAVADSWPTYDSVVRNLGRVQLVSLASAPL